MSANVETLSNTRKRLVLSERIKIAVSAVIDEYARDLDQDPALRAVRIEVRVKPDGDIRAVVLDRQSEIADRDR